MRIGIAQIDSRPGDFDKTCERMLAYSKVAAERDVDLLIFPSLALTGIEGVRQADQLPFLHDLLACLGSLAEGIACPCLMAILVSYDDVVAMEAILLKDGKVMLINLAGSFFGAAMEAASPRGSLPEQGVPILSLGGEQLAVALTFDDLDRLRSGQSGATVIVYLDDQGFHVDDPSTALGAGLTEGRFSEDAKASGAWFVGVGALGLYGESVYCGSSFVLSPAGELVAAAPDFEEGFVSCEVGADVSVAKDAVLSPEVYDQTFQLWQALTLGVRDIVEKHRCVEHAVLPLDGTLSSELLAMLASDALGPTKVHALIATDDAEGTARARELAGRLRLDLREAHATLWDAAGGSVLLGRARAAAQLAVWADELGACVLSPRDKTDLALGLWADVPSSAAAMPLGDVYRSDIVDLARLRNTISPIMGSVALSRLDLPTVPGITLPSDSVEECVYAVDSILLEHVEGRHGVKDVVEVTGRDPNLVREVLLRLNDTEATRVGVPTVIVTSSAPLTNATQPLGLVWRADGSREEQELQRTLLQLAEKVLSIPDNLRPAALEPKAEVHAQADEAVRQLKDALSFLNDFTQGGGMDIKDSESLQDWLKSLRSGGKPDKPFGNMLIWGSPFSEN